MGERGNDGGLPTNLIREEGVEVGRNDQIQDTQGPAEVRPA